MKTLTYIINSDHKQYCREKSDMKNNKYAQRNKMTVLCLVFVSAFFFLACGETNFLNRGKPVIAESLGSDYRPPLDDDITFHDLFSIEPGQYVPLRSYSGAVDPVGTAITDDFDGDGIINAKETTTNVWVADYPVIDASVSPPITMRVEILESGTETSETFESEISASDVERNIDNSTEAVHRNEVNLRTVQFQDSFKSSGSASYSFGMNLAVSAGVNVMGCGGSASVAMSSKVSGAMSKSYGETKTKWQDVPFKDSLSRDNTSIKRSEAAKNSRNLRREVRNKGWVKTEVKPNAGYIRAALYISNYSVNMPVKLKNILCSFMLETPEGQLLPVDNFLIRNEDYSVFSVELYGGSTFGPYVIELSGLNTAEIKNAISMGYNPRIFVITYDMTHVADSNYRLALSSSFTGNNLKIIEENAKGRTSGIKLVGPGFREFYRVVAFDTAGPAAETRTTQPSDVDSISPGVTLEKALNRVSFSGTPITFADYVLDFSGIDPEMKIMSDDGITPYETPRFQLRGVKSVNGVETKIPTKMVAPDGTIIMKPLAEWTQEDYNNFRVWVVFDKGKYFRHAGDFNQRSNPLINATAPGEYTYNDGTSDITVPKVQGIVGCIWPGDHYDIVYLNLSEVLGLIKEFGNNPIETETVLPFNTRWKKSDLGDYPFNPDVHSQYLGQVIGGDVIDLSIKLLGTRYLDPDFGSPVDTGTADEYSNFYYGLTNSTRRFSIKEALDFEVSFGVDGKFTDWMNIADLQRNYMDTGLLPVDFLFMKDYYSNYYIDSLGGTLVDPATSMNAYSWDYMNQVFNVKLQVPYYLPCMGDDGQVGVYLRTAANNAFRDSIWPLRHYDVKKFRGRIITLPILTVLNSTGPAALALERLSGTIEQGDRLDIKSAAGSASYTVDSVSCDDSSCRALINNLNLYHKKGDWVSVDLAETPAEQQVTLQVDHGFVESWNAEWVAAWNGLWNGLWEYVEGKMPLIGSVNPGDYSPARNLGFNPTTITANWIGNNNFDNPNWNNWADASNYQYFLMGQLDPLVSASGGGIRLLSPGDSGEHMVLGASPNASWINSAASGNRALVVWRGVGGINGRLIDMNTGQMVGNEIPISTVQYGDLFQICVSGDRALVVWTSDDPDTNNNIVRGRIINISTGVFLSDDFRISPDDGSSYSTAFTKCVIDGNRALVLYYQTGTDVANNGEVIGVRGKFIDMLAANPVDPSIGNDFNIATTMCGRYGALQGVVSNNRALVTWFAGEADDYMEARGRIINMQALSGTDAGMGDDFLISERETVFEGWSWGSNMIDCLVRGTRVMAVTAWRKTRGVFIDMTAVTGSDPRMGDIFEIDNNLTGGVQIAQYGDNIFMAKLTIEDEELRTLACFLDGVTGQKISNDVIISNANPYIKDMIVIGARAVFLPLVASDVEITITDLESDILKSFNLLIGQGYIACSFANSGERLLGSWYQPDTETEMGTVYGKYFDYIPDNPYLMKYGISNFLVAPLIERDYSVSVKINEYF